ncbi:MAG: recombination-associated protein RdgC [Gammaproteobacteria bacterium]|jgi:recombination associated protein RdgC|nr:recombination-associated protein RdgC [Gammaproteobacteria bacterium]MBT5371800.1 recombination-associated protein RdgC [Gammaproteobacteria bacterium]MBT7479713.1 recombination-associated protein RdgC [Gammaproteobacteria bacterium]
MFFNKLTVYEILESPFDNFLSIDVLIEQMKKRPSRKPGALELKTKGWTNPIRGDDKHIYLHNKQILICLEIHKRKITSSDVNMVLDEQIAEIEKEEKRTVGCSEKKRLYDELFVEMLPTAFIGSNRLHAIIDTENNRLLINTDSNPAAEELTVLLRETVGNLSLCDPQLAITPSGALSQWLKNSAPPVGWTIDDECVIQETDGSGKMTFSHVDVTSGAVRKHLDNQARVVKMGLSWMDKFSFTIDQNLRLSKIKMLDLLSAQRDEQYEGAVEKIELEHADFILMSSVIEDLITEMFVMFGRQKPDLGPLPTVNTEDSEPPPHSTDEGKDPLYEEAMMIVIESQKASVSQLQRRLRIGYNRASLLIERMELKGIVSAFDDKGKRTVLVQIYIPEDGED